MEIKTPVTTVRVDFECPKCKSIMHFTGQDRGGKYSHTCSGKVCKYEEFLDKMYPAIEYLNKGKKK